MKSDLLLLFLMARKSAIPVSAMVLKGIPEILSPELLEVLASMGQGDTIIIGDSSFPAASMSSYGNRLFAVGAIASAIPGPRLLRADGRGIPELLEAILKLLPVEEAIVKNEIDSQRMKDYDNYLYKAEGRKVKMEKIKLQIYQIL